MLPYKAGFEYPIGFRYPRISVSEMIFDQNRSSGRARILSSVFGAQTLHPIQIRPVAILTQVHVVNGSLKQRDV